MRIAFLGTPEFAVEVLRRLVTAHEVVAVISQPDRAKDRKNRLLATPTKAFATEAGIPVFQFERIKTAADELRTLKADIFVTAAYGQLLSKEVIDIPRYGIVNVHASLLPKYRGSSPIQSAILNGDEVTGVSIMQTDVGMDTGDILMQREVEIGDMNAGMLGAKLASVGGELLIETLKRIEDGSIKPIKQDETKATHCRKISSGDEKLDFSLDYRAVCNKIRAFCPEPVAYTTLNGERFKICAASVVQGNGEAGEIISCDRTNGLVVACKGGAIRLTEVQPASKKVMTDLEFINGKKVKVGDRFGK